MKILAMLPATLCVVLAALAVPALAAPPVVLDVPAELRPLLETHLSVLRDDALAETADARDRRALVRRARREIRDLLATEGYFTPTVTREGEDRRPIRLRVEPGPRATIGQVELRFEGAIAQTAHAERRRAIEAEWPLAVGKPFRQGAWDNAKGWLVDRVSQRDFAAARLRESRATVDPEKARVALVLAVDSGAPYTLGALQVDGLDIYSLALVERYNDIAAGDPYDRDRLLDLQRSLQGTPYFSSVIVDVATDGASSTEVPVQVTVTEALPKRVDFGAGFSSNNGYRVESAYRHANWLDRGWLLTTGLRLEQRHQLAYADVFLPPARQAHQDSFGAQFERSDTQGLRITTRALGAGRRHVRGDIETHLAFKLQRETYAPDGVAREHRKALTANWTWTARRIDNLLDPREGYILSGQIGGGAKAAFSDQNFLRLSGRAVRYQPVGARDVLILRAEGGMTMAESRDNIPQDFLFRAGGTQSVRGYAYQSLGVKEGGAVVGGRYMALLGAEYVHWWKNNWGAAAFVDAGNAADDRPAFRLLPGYGLGARWRSPAGPLAVDLAYGHAEQTLRLHFSIAVAF